MKPGIASLYLLCTVALCNFTISPSVAQISSDGTVSTTVTITNAINFLIENGDRAGDNLFHSFSEFSVPNLGEAYFNNVTDIVNIFSRVTGGNISDIQGLIRANGAANLFLINPAGIVFGENASLNIGGSFFATTAESVVFSDGIEFSATNTDTATLLTINIPVGLQMGSNPGDIIVQGKGYNPTLSRRRSLPFDRSTSTRGLEVFGGQTISLVAGNIFLDSGVLTAESGRIELGAIGQNANPLVNLNSTDSGWQLGYEGITNFGNIQLNERSLIDASGIDGGSIHLQGRQIELLNASTLLIQNAGNQSAGTIQVDATDALVMQGNNLGGLAASEIRADSLGNEKGADITIETQQLNLRDGSSVVARTFGLGDGGDITVRATEGIEINGFDPGSLTTNSIISTSTRALAGNAGNILVSTGQLRILEGGNINSSSLGVGAGGDITVNATESVEISGTNPFRFIPSNIAVLTLGSSAAGRLTINTKQVTVRDGAQISSASLASGAAGDLTINASEFVAVEGQFLTNSPTQISAATEFGNPGLREAFGLPPVPTGESGNLSINTPALRVLDGGIVSVRNDGTSGNAGSLKVNADAVVLDNQGSLTAIARNGDGGDIVLDAQNLTISNGGQINASTLTSQGGNITLQIHNTLQLRNQGQILANALQAGQSGNITINASNANLNQGSSISNNALGTATGGELHFTGGSLSLFGGSSFSAITSGSGKAGNLFVQAGDIEVSGVENTEIGGMQTLAPSFIAAGTFFGSSGQGGSLTVIGDDIRISNGGLISAGTAGTGASGDVEIFASESLEVSGVGDLPAPLFGYDTNHPSRISASSGSDASAGYVRIHTPLLLVSDGGVVEVNGLGAGGAGNLEVISDRILLDNNASLQANVASGNQGNINLTSQFLFLRHNSNITTDAGEQANGGNINIDTVNLVALENNDITANAVQGQGGNIIVTAQGVFLSPDSQITASSEFGIDGVVTINNPDADNSAALLELPTDTTDASQQIAEGCAWVQNNRFTVTGRGGVPENPANNLVNDQMWSDIRDLSSSVTSHQSPVTSGENPRRRQAQGNAHQESHQSPVIEANALMVNEQGNVELVAVVNSQHPDNALTQANCTAQ